MRIYTHAIEDLEAGRLPAWEKLAAPPIAINYWRLPKDAMMRDVLLAVRADEAIHRDVNHVLASTKKDDPNPFVSQHDETHSGSSGRPAGAAAGTTGSAAAARAGDSAAL